MKLLHAYWRVDYVAAPKPEEVGRSLFLELPSKSDEAAHILWRGAKTYIVLNAFPYNAGHLLVVPYRAVADLQDLELEEYQELWEAIVLSQKLLTQTIKPQGFNIGFNIGSAAGGSITQHLHCHVVPRWAGDNNFMPVMSDTKVLSQSLDSLWRQLKSCLALISGRSHSGS